MGWSVRACEELRKEAVEDMGDRLVALPVKGVLAGEFFTIS